LITKRKFQVIYFRALNPLITGLVKRPEDYRWFSPTHHVQTDNKGRFLSFNFGLKEFGKMMNTAILVTPTSSVAKSLYIRTT
jgi:hypothetical protein